MRCINKNYLHKFDNYIKKQYNNSKEGENMKKFIVKIIAILIFMIVLNIFSMQIIKEIGRAHV